MKTKQQLCKKEKDSCILLAKKIVKEKANYTCVKCGRKDKQLQGSHIYPVGRYGAMAADTDNILCLCAGCHMWSNDSWHENPLESAEWFHQKYPERYQTLKERSWLNQKADIIFWKKKRNLLEKL